MLSQPNHNKRDEKEETWDWIQRLRWRRVFHRRWPIDVDGSVSELHRNSNSERERERQRQEFITFVKAISRIGLCFGQRKGFFFRKVNFMLTKKSNMFL